MAEGQWKVLITDPKFADFADTVADQFPQLELVCATEEGDAKTHADDGVHGLLTQFERVDAELLGALPNLRVVVKNGRSYHNIDVDAVRARDVAFGSVPRKGPNCVAELALTLILASSKDLVISHKSVADGAYRYRGMKPELTAERKMAFHWMRHVGVHEVVGKTLGIIGMGEIGCELARRAEVMGMRNIYYKRTPLSPELERRFNASYRDLDTLLAESDYVCVALPHTPESEKLIGATELSKMKESAFIINIARGGIIDEEALIEALATRSIRGAGLDVFTYEPLPADSPLCTLDNVILTPHIGGGSGTTWAGELAAGLAEVASLLDGNRPLVDLAQG
jgi:lactate dehydrogenase-like 2-hydroxyacid dehydrogenase